MSHADPHILKAREALVFASFAMAGGYPEEAGGSAYMAAYHAALAFIAARTGKSPKTHSGACTEFARLAREEPRIGRDQVSLLAWSYELKNVADYEQTERVSRSEAERAIEEASRLMETIASLV